MIPSRATECCLILILPRWRAPPVAYTQTLMLPTKQGTAGWCRRFLRGDDVCKGRASTRMQAVSVAAHRANVVRAIERRLAPKDSSAS
jgi:hypothetical protein